MQPRVRRCYDDPVARNPRNQNQAANARRRAAEHFARAIERVTTRDEAWRFVLSGPRGVEPGAAAYHRLSHFLKHDEPPAETTREECELYLALVRRFLKSGSIAETEGKRLIATLAQAAAK